MKIIESILALGLVVCLILLLVYSGWILTLILVLDVVLLLSVTFITNKINEGKSKDKGL